MAQLLRSFLRLSRRIPTWLRVLLTGVVSVGLLWVYRRYSLTFDTNDDHANMLLEGEAFARGNYLLSHWYLTTVSWYATDVPLYALGVAVRGFDPVLLHEVPTAVFAVVLGIALFLAGHTPGAKSRWHWLGTAVAFALIGFPGALLASHLLLGPWRTVSVLLGLVVFSLLDTRDGARIAPWRLFAITAALTIALISDNFPMYVVVAPILAVSAFRAWRLPAARSIELQIVAATVVGVVLAKICLHLVTARGGFILLDYFSSSVKTISNRLPSTVFRCVSPSLWQSICWLTG